MTIDIRSTNAAQFPAEQSIQLPEQFVIKRRPEVLNRFSIGNTCLYARIKEGLIPTPISLLGGRSVGWLEHEIDHVLAAMVAGKSEDHIKVLVSHLVDQRKLATVRSRVQVGSAPEVSV